MGFLKSGLFAIVLTSLVGSAAVVGCTADGSTDGIADDLTVLPSDDASSKLPPSSSSGDNNIPDAGKDASKKDGGKSDGGFDAGPPPPVEGTSCPTLNTIGKKSCGICGTAETVCLDDGTGKGTWSEYGQCNNQLANGCTPGEVITEDCGDCGKQVKTCNQYCAFSTGACTGQPANHCKPGKLEYTGAGCATPSTYRNRTCGDTCVWGGYSTCETPVNELVLDIGAAVGDTTTLPITFSAARMISRLASFGTCPLAASPTAGDYPYQYIELRNPSAMKAKVTVYASAAAGGPVIDTIMAVYATNLAPMDDTARKLCRDGVNDQSASADVGLTGNANFSLIKGVLIPAGGSVLVYLSTFYQTSSLTQVTQGDLNINTKLESLQ